LLVFSRIQIFIIVFSCFYCVISYGAQGKWTPRLKLQNQETIFIGSDAVITAQENYQKVIVLWGDLDFSGTTDEMIVLSGNVHLRSGSRIEKSLVILGGGLARDNGSFIKGDQIQFQAPSSLPKPLLLVAPYIGLAAEGTHWFIVKTFQILFLWLSGIFAYFIAPRFLKNVEKKFRKEKTRNFIFSLFALLLFVPSLLLLVISLIGIPLIPFYLFLYGSSLFLAYIVMASILGQWLPPQQENKEYSSWRLFLGLVVLLVFRMIFPLMGFMIISFFAFISWGALLRALHERIFSSNTK